MFTDPNYHSTPYNPITKPFPNVCPRTCPPANPIPNLQTPTQTYQPPPKTGLNLPGANAIKTWGTHNDIPAPRTMTCRKTRIHTASQKLKYPKSLEAWVLSLPAINSYCLSIRLFRFYPSYIELRSRLSDGRKTLFSASGGSEGWVEC